MKVLFASLLAALFSLAALAAYAAPVDSSGMSADPQTAAPADDDKDKDKDKDTDKDKDGGK